MIERFATVRVKKLLPVEDKTFPECFVKTRRLNMEGTVDSPIYNSFNHHWLVKHVTSRLVRGISVGYYGIYHEDELEIIATPQTNYPDLDDLDLEYNWKDDDSSDF